MWVRVKTVSGSVCGSVVYRCGSGLKQEVVVVVVVVVIVVLVVVVVVVVVVLVVIVVVVVCLSDTVESPHQ